jgi:AcrR family transcriptional regulator
MDVASESPTALGDMPGAGLPSAGPPPAGSPRPAGRPGRPRSDRAHRDIRAAFRALLIQDGYGGLRLEHVAARAGVGKATIYRHWPSKQALAQDVLFELASPHLEVPDMGDTRAELLACVMKPLGAIRDTDFGPVIRALLSEIAGDPRLGDPFRATVVQARRTEVARVVQRGIARGDLRAEVDTDVATELLVGPVYFRLVFGGPLDAGFAEKIVDSVLLGYEARPRRGAGARRRGHPGGVEAAPQR